MPEFTYSGRDAQGKLVEGVLEETSQTLVAAQLLKRSITPINIEQSRVKVESGIPVFKLSTGIKKEVNLDELSMFCRQMHALAKSGIPIIQAVNGLADNTENSYFKKVLKEVVEGLVAGSPLSTVFGRYPKIFSQMFVSMIHMGETTGHLDKAFIKLIDHIELERETKRRVSQAVRYPMSVMIAMIFAMAIINVFVIPNFAGVFAKLGADLPLPTRILMLTSNFTVNYWWIILLFLCAIFIVLRHTLSTEKGAYAWDKAKLDLPIFGKIFRKIILARFTRSFSMLSESGISILPALHITSRVVDNRHVTASVKNMIKGVERGDTLTNTAAASGLFAGIVLQMISVGEETGSIDVLFNEVADFYEEEVDFDLKRLSDAIEPIVLVFMGILVLVLALGVFLPMWNLSGIMK